jgi:hypothetical protein
MLAVAQAVRRSVLVFRAETMARHFRPWANAACWLLAEISAQALQRWTRIAGRDMLHRKLIIRDQTRQEVLPRGLPGPSVPTL